MENNSRMLTTFTNALTDGSFDIFPTTISSDPYLVYHGTSSVYSEGIETNGFTIGYLPIAKHKIEALIGAFEILGEKSDYDPNAYFQVKFNSPGLLEHYLSKVTTKSFSPISYIAARYASQPLVGGQIIVSISEAALNAKEKLKLMVRTADNIEETIENCDDILRECELLRSAPGVVYAVQISQEVIDGFKATPTGVLLSIVNIPAANIVGKVILPADYVLPRRDPQLEKQILMQKLVRENCVARVIYRREDDEPEEDQ